MKTKRALLSAVISACFLLQGSAFALDEPQTQTKPLVLNQLGGLAFGGTVSHKPNGLTFHGDHGYAQYVFPLMQKIIPLSFGMALANRAAVSRLRLTAEKASRHFCRETDGQHISLTNLAEAELEELKQQKQKVKFRP